MSATVLKNVPPKARSSSMRCPKPYLSGMKIALRGLDAGDPEFMACLKRLTKEFEKIDAENKAVIRARVQEKARLKAREIADAKKAKRRAVASAA